jgi:hypothetical protein
VDSLSQFLRSFCAFLFFSALAVPMSAEAKVTQGTAKCTAGMLKRTDSGVTCTIPLKVRPPASGGTGSPNDWGMCGIQKLSANFGPPTVARIIVDATGHYAVELAAFTAAVMPVVHWTCVLFSDFKGVPPPSEATFFPPPSLASGSKTIKGSAGYACIWAGLAGNLETISGAGGGSDGAFGSSYAEVDKTGTILEAENVTSYALCSGYSTASWKGWKYHPSIGVGLQTPPAGGVSIGTDEAHYWCYMGGIAAQLRYPTFSVGPISAGLDLSGDKYRMFALALPPNPPSPGGVLMNYNCLPLTQ